MRAAVVLAVWAGACGPSSAQVRSAKTASYEADPIQLMELAASAARDEHYQIGDVNPQELTFITRARMYSPEGDLESPGAEGFIQSRPGSVFVSFVVHIVEGEMGRKCIVVKPHTLQMVQGSPKPRELDPEDPNLPGFVKGRADALALAIYQRAKRFLVQPP
jgi:hypothetical protein